MLGSKDFALGRKEVGKTSILSIWYGICLDSITKTSIIAGIQRIYLWYGGNSQMHRFEADLDDDQRSSDRIKTDELDAFRIAIYCDRTTRRFAIPPASLTCLSILI